MITDPVQGPAHSQLPVSSFRRSLFHGLLCAACSSSCGGGGDPADAPPDAGPTAADAGAISFDTLLVHPDRLGFIGPGGGRSIELLARRTADGALEAVAPDPAIVSSLSSAPDVAALEGLRVRAWKTGSARITVTAGGESVEIVVEVGAGPAPFAQSVIDHAPGPGAGYGAALLPGVVLGPPKGGGELEGSLDVLSLGLGGSVTLGLGAQRIYDGPGADLIVFENPFLVRAPVTFAEPGRVELATAEGAAFALPCAPAAFPYPGCAGVAPVLSGPGAPAVDPTDPAAAGGDALDVAGASRTGSNTGSGSASSTAAFAIFAGADRVRIHDVATGTITGDNSGFDLDAVAFVHVLPPDVTALAASPAQVTLRAGESVPMPRADALTSGGAVALHGIAAKVEVSPASGPISLSGSVLRAERAGTARLLFSAGPFRADVSIEVMP